jgi:hypothetical protein
MRQRLRASSRNTWWVLALRRSVGRLILMPMILYSTKTRRFGACTPIRHAFTVSRRFLACRYILSGAGFFDVRGDLIH